MMKIGENETFLLWQGYMYTGAVSGGKFGNSYKNNAQPFMGSGKK